MTEAAIRDGYHGDDIDWWLNLIRKVIYHRPELNCEMRGDLELFDKLEPHKSLRFSNGKGMPIGNLTSQIFANFYMTLFDKWILSQLRDNERYGRFVDDFFIVSNDKKHLLELLNRSRYWPKDNLDVSLHPRKVYLQEVHKGFEFVGTIIKQGRSYTTNRTISNAMALVKSYDGSNTDKFVASYNSYMGFLIHNNTYAIRWNLWKSITNYSGICCHNMKKLVILNKNQRYEQTDSDGILTAAWSSNNEEDYDELHQDNNQC